MISTKNQDKGSHHCSGATPFIIQKNFTTMFKNFVNLRRYVIAKDLLVKITKNDSIQPIKV